MQLSIKSKLLSSNFILFYFALFKFLLLIFFAGNYGLFRDEFYYLECSKHLAFGYVDQQPLNAILLWISTSLFGESIIGIRIFSYLAGSITVIIGGLIAREFGGGKFSQILTAIVIIFSGVVLGGSSYYSMNSFDVLLSTITFLYVIRLLKTKNQKIWITIGVLIGIGLQNKLTFIFLGFGLIVGLLLTKERIYFKSKHFWFGMAISFLILLPNIIWQIFNGFPTVEFMRNAALYKNLSMSLPQFLLSSSLELNPGFVIFIITAFYFFFINKIGKIYKLIGFIFIIVLLVFAFNNGKAYYMGVFFPVMLASGALGADILIEKYLRNWVRTILLISLIPSMILVTPYAIPILNVESFLKFSDFTGIKPGASERNTLGVLPQFFADRFGWKDMVKEVNKVYSTLSDEEKRQVVIFGQNYGEAGAINYFGTKYNLPEAISNHNNYWIWGYPENRSGEIFIIVGSTLEDNKKYFKNVKIMESHYNKFGMPYENVDIFLARKPKGSIKKHWPKMKNFI